MDTKEGHNEKMASEKFYPSEENLGKNCKFWQGIELTENSAGQLAVGCCYPKMELEGRTSCEGIVDDVCLFIKSGRKPSSLSVDQMDEIRFRIPGITKNDLPPGNTE